MKYLLSLLILFAISITSYAQPGDPGGDPDCPAIADYINVGPSGSQAAGLRVFNYKALNASAVPFQKSAVLVVTVSASASNPPHHGTNVNGVVLTPGSSTTFSYSKIACGPTEIPFTLTFGRPIGCTFTITLTSITNGHTLSFVSKTITLN